jgi:hypothetical protein
MLLKSVTVSSNSSLAQVRFPNIDAMLSPQPAISSTQQQQQQVTAIPIHATVIIQNAKS